MLFCKKGKLTTRVKCEKFSLSMRSASDGELCDGELWGGELSLAVMGVGRLVWIVGSVVWVRAALTSWVA